ncbi:MAG TPA: hypothetical protein VFL82_10165 [Thermomicrobiales bacterium]|nr:hypothetical protein [Thermomicrobiales bacterium]
MIDAHLRHLHAPSGSSLRVSDALFAWRGGQVALLGERTDDHWVLARGWPEEDRLADIRRWYFSSPEAFATQVFRLVREATCNIAESTHVRDAALTWATAADLADCR